MKFKLQFEMDNAAFSDWDGYGDEPDRKTFSHAEVTRILENVANRINDHDTTGVIFDHNGNKVGEWKITGKRPV